MNRNIQVAPLLFLPALIRLRLPHSMEMEGKEGPAFAFEHLWIHTGKALRLLVDPGIERMSAPWVVWVLILGAVAVLVRALWRQSHPSSDTRTLGVESPEFRDFARDVKLAWSVYALFFVLMMSVIFAFWWGDLMRLVSMRFALPMLAALALFAALGLGKLPPRTYALLVVLLLVAMGTRLPTARDGGPLAALSSWYLRDATIDILRAQGACQPVLVTDRGSQYLVRGVSAIKPWYYLQHREALDAMSDAGQIGPIVVADWTWGDGTRFEARRLASVHEWLEQGVRSSSRHLHFFERANRHVALQMSVMAGHLEPGKQCAGLDSMRGARWDESVFGVPFNHSAWIGMN